MEQAKTFCEGPYRPRDSSYEFSEIIEVDRSRHLKLYRTRNRAFFRQDLICADALPGLRVLSIWVVLHWTCRSHSVWAFHALRDRRRVRGLENRELLNKGGPIHVNSPKSRKGECRLVQRPRLQRGKLLPRKRQAAANTLLPSVDPSRRDRAGSKENVHYD